MLLLEQLLFYTQQTYHKVILSLPRVTNLPMDSLISFLLTRHLNNYILIMVVFTTFSLLIKESNTFDYALCPSILMSYSLTHLHVYWSWAG